MSEGPRIVVVPDRFLGLQALREYGEGIPLADFGKDNKAQPLADQRCVRIEFHNGTRNPLKVVLLTVDGARCLAERLLFTLNRLGDT